MTPDYLAEHARLYARADIAVFPLWGIVDTGDTRQCSCPDGASCTSPGKHPRIPPAHRRGDPLSGKCKGDCGSAGHGVHDATTDIDTLTRWWDLDPTANIGHPAHDNGYAILDVDPKSGGEESFDKLRALVLRRARVDLMETLVQRTGSGGMHLLYTAPESGIKSGSKVFGGNMPGLDTRGNGGYIVTWPSLHVSGREYEYIDWLREPAIWPEILTGLMSPPKAAPPPARRAAGDADSRYAEAALRREIDLVRTAGEGTRNDTLNAAAFNLGQLIGGGQLSEAAARAELVAAGTAIGLSMTETLKTVASGLAGGAASPRNRPGI